jgi:hypothetical protein
LQLHYSISSSDSIAEIAITDEAGQKTVLLAGEGTLNLQTGASYRLTVRTNITAVEDVNIPDEFTLSQNYPNPFNPVTNIRYGIPEASHVKVQIFNVQGQLVRTLLSAEQPAGYHTIQWNGRNDFGNQLGSGVYFYRVQAGKEQMIKKMLLVK